MQRIAQDVSTLMSVINTEDKQIDTVATTQVVTSTSSLVYAIGTVAQGTSGLTRVGDSILINRIDLNLQFLFSTGTPATTASQNQIFRWFLVRYLKTPATNGVTAFLISEFLNVDSGSNYTPMSLPNTDTNENFQIMESGTVNLTVPSSTTAASAVTQMVTTSHTCHFHQTYNGSATNSITDNMVFMVFVALNGANAGGSSNVLVSSRMWFVDN
jgi:hypothetical protein